MSSNSSSVLRVGDGVDIRILQHVEQGLKTGERPESYVSKIQNILDNGNIEIDMPTQGGRNMPLLLGVRLEFQFNTKGGLYRCVGHIKERYIRDNMCLILIEPKTPLEKFQRREYYRLECALNMHYQTIEEDEVDISPIDELKEHHRLTYPEDLEKEAIAVDLSGGGMRFVSYEEGHKGEYLVITLPLESKSMSYTLEVVASVVNCQQVTKNMSERKDKRKRYEYRVKFLEKNPKVRERIIKFIFEQERLRRQKG